MRLGIASFALAATTFIAAAPALAFPHLWRHRRPPVTVQVAPGPAPADGYNYAPGYAAPVYGTDATVFARHVDDEVNGIEEDAQSRVAQGSLSPAVMDDLRQRRSEIVRDTEEAGRSGGVTWEERQHIQQHIADMRAATQRYQTAPPASYGNSYDYNYGGW